MDIKKGIQLSVIIGLLLTLILPFFMMSYDTYISGDEVITYSMANNDNGGFVFSEGRVASYIKNEIFDDSVSETLMNLKDFAVDILKNKKSAQFFQYARNPEIAIYSNSEINDWFSKRNDETFNIGTTWLYSLSDDANSYLYYCLLNFVSSLFVGISGTKWVGFILNYLCFLLCLFEIFKISKSIGMSKVKSIVASVIWGTSVVEITTVTYIRTYICATAFALLVTQLHVNLFKKIKADSNYCFGNELIWIIVAYVFSYIAHYTNAIVLCSLAFVMFVFMIKYGVKVKRIVLYCIGIFIAIGLGIIADPTSVLGLASKLMAASGDNVTMGEKAIVAWKYLSETIFPNTVICSLVVAAIFYEAVRYFQTKRKSRDDSEVIYLSLTTVVFFIVVLIGTGRLDYSRVIMPILAILLVDVVSNTVKILFANKKKTATIWCTLIATIIVVSGIHGGMNRLATENSLQAGVDNALEDYVGYYCLYFRHRSGGYQDVVNLRNMSSAQIVTIDTPDWGQLADQSFDCSDQILVFFTFDTFNEDTTQWVIDAGYQMRERVYAGESTQIYVATR